MQIKTTIRYHLTPVSMALIRRQKRTGVAGHQWLTFTIVAIQEAEIRRIKVRSQTLSRKYLTQKGLVEWLKV
jgi:hypothetical protein